jgi:uncharacterized membrane protein
MSSPRADSRGHARPSRSRLLGWSARFRAREWLARSWLVIPSVYVIAALALGKIIPELERSDVDTVGLDIDAESARQMLAAVASGMIAFTGLVVSVAVVVVQFGAGQYTPRLVLRFRRDPVVKHALGIFIAPALYALVSMSDVSGSGDPTAPNLTTMVAVVLLVAAVVAFFHLVARLLDLLRPRRLFAQLAAAGERAIDDVYPQSSGAELPVPVELPPVTEVIPHRGSSGVLSALDHDRLVEAANAADGTIEVAWSVGAFVRHGESLFRLRGATSPVSRKWLASAAIIAEERTLTQDPAFAIRTIVDIALRALSPAVNDPTTAVQALDALESLLLRLAGRDLGGGHFHDTAGRVRVVYPAPDWDDLLDLACTEIRHYGAGAHQATRRLRALLVGLIEEAPSMRHAAVHAQLALLDDAVSRAHPDPAERAIARVADHVGLGGHATEPAR